VRRALTAIFLAGLTLGPLGAQRAPAYQQDPPRIEHLGSVERGLFQPIRIACGPQGNLYVTETLRGEVRVFSPGGDLIEARHPCDLPLSVAVDGRGRIYVGSQSGGICVFDYAWNRVGEIGFEGAGEVLEPSDMAVDPATGRLYVTDSGSSCVKVYSLAGEFLFQFGEFEGFPSGIAVDVLGRRVLVGDPVASEVRVFDMDGRSLLSFGERGADPGQLVRVQGLCVDGKRRIYVTDAFLGVVNVFDAEGRYLTSFGGLGDAPGQFRQPMDVTVDSLNRLVVVSANTARLEFFSAGDMGRTDAPTAPRLIWPAQGGVVPEKTPTFVVEKSFDPNDVYLAYTFEVYEDEWLQFLYVSSETGGEVDVMSSTVSWVPPVEFEEGKTYWWRVRASDSDGPGPWSPLGTFTVAGGERLEFALEQAYPNPFASEATIRFTLPRECNVDLRIFDASGRQVRVLRQGPETEGVHALTWDGRDDAGNRLPAGIYWYKLAAGGFVETRKVVLVP